MNPDILKIDGWMSELEMKWLYKVASQVPVGGLIVEIGAWKGRSSSAIYDGTKVGTTCVSVDTWEGSPLEMADFDVNLDVFQIYLENMSNLGFPVCPFGCRPAVNQAGGDKNESDISYIKGDSVESATLFGDKTIDWLFIDGEHSKCGEDIDAYLPKMKSCSLLTGHDYFGFFESIQQEIHKRFYINQVVHNIWVKYVNGYAPGWYTIG